MTDLDQKETEEFEQFDEQEQENDEEVGEEWWEWWDQKTIEQLLAEKQALEKKLEKMKKAKESGKKKLFELKSKTQEQVIDEAVIEKILEKRERKAMFAREYPWIDYEDVDALSQARGIPFEEALKKFQPIKAWSMMLWKDKVVVPEKKQDEATKKRYEKLLWIS